MKNKNYKKGTTLTEMMIYLSLFVVVSFLVYQFFNTIFTQQNLKNTLKSEKIIQETENIIDEIIKNGTDIQIANNGITLTPWGCDLQCWIGIDPEYNCFVWSGGCTKDCQGGSNGCIGEPLPIGVGLNNVEFDYDPNNNIAVDNYYLWAWSDNAGWTDWTNVTLDKNTNELIGYAKFINDFDNISLNCLTTNTCNKTNYKVYLDKDNQLHGYAWGDYTGWISFNCQEGGNNQTNICSTSNYNVSIDPATGDWNGYAWSENIGWISFNCATGGQTANNICDISNYKVKDSRTKTNAISIKFQVIDENKKPSNIKWNFPYDTRRTIAITSITPNTGLTTNNNLTISSIVGIGFQTGALVKFTGKESTIIYPKTHFNFVSSSQLANGVFDLTNKTTGTYDVIVINPDGSSGILKNGFTITNGS